ncbi:hypothetical protein BHM03_00024359, partial [Ensete ventricosum]
MAKSAYLGGCVGNVRGPRRSEAAHVAGRRNSGVWGVRVVALMGDSGLTWSGTGAAAHGLTDRSNVGPSVRSNVGWAVGGPVNVSNLAAKDWTPPPVLERDAKLCPLCDTPHVATA